MSDPVKTELISKPSRRSFSLSLCFIVFLFLFLWITGWFYPFQGDDFMFLCALREKGIGGYIVQAYLTYTLRIGEVFVLCCLKNGKTVFNLLNPLMQLALAILLFRFGFHRFPRSREAADYPALALLFAMSAILTARPRDTVFWMTGTCVYAWGLALWFGFWGEMQTGAGKRGIWYVSGLFLAGIMAAMVLENVMPVGWLLGGRLLFRDMKEKRPIPAGVTGGLAGYGIGSLIFLLAPGRWLRMQTVTGALTLTGRFFKVAEVGIFWAASAWFAFVLWGICALLLYFWSRRKLREEIPHQLELLGAAALSGAVLAAAGVAPAMRGYLFSSLLIALAAVRLFVRLAACGDKGRKYAKLLLSCCLLWSCGLLLSSLPAFLQIKRDEEARCQLTAAGSKANPLVVPEHRVLRKHFLQYIWIEDFTESPEHVTNRNAAQYYRVPAIRIDRKSEIPLYWKGKK